MKKNPFFFIDDCDFYSIILYMNWLIISDDINETEKLKSLINEKFKGSIVYSFTSDAHELKTSFEIVEQITQVVVLDSHDNPSVTFLAGIFCGRKVPVYAAGRRMEDYLSVFTNCNFYDDAASLMSFLKKNAKSIIREETKTSAFAYLFENGIPFDADHFSEYLIPDKDPKKAERKKEILECYLSAGLDINARDKDGTPVLNVACRYENLDAVKWLCSLGADINAVSEDRGYTALMDAVWKGNKEIAAYLVSQKADLNIISKEGQSNLILAVGADRTEIVQLLAENGADPDIQDGMGMSAFAYAQLFKKEEILAILEKYHKE